MTPPSGTETLDCARGDAPAWMRVGAVALTLLALLGIGWMLAWLVAPMPGSRRWIDVGVLPLSLAALAVLVGLRHESHWRAPLRRLRRLIESAQQGEAPLQDLDRVGGGIAPLAPAVRDLLIELKQRRGEVRALHSEMAQRVALRTSALERRLGSAHLQARRDALSGLGNRRLLDELLPGWIAQCRRDGLELCVLLIDIDHFKLLNDSLGHLAGDELLRDIGQIIASAIRGSDHAFRLGGDEFLVVMPGASAAAAQALGKRLMSLVDGLARPLKLERRPRLSIGAAMLGELEQPTAEALLERADRRLYALKQQRGSLRRAS